MKYAFCLVVMLIGAESFAKAKILMIIPNNFMWPEYSVPRKIYESAGFEVVTAGNGSKSMDPDKRNKKDYPDSGPVQTDLNYDQIDISKFTAITFVAGAGAWADFFPNEKIHSIVSDAIKTQKILGLLCASTGLLGLADNWSGTSPLAAGRSAVAYYKVEGLVQSQGHIKLVKGGRQEPGAIADGNLITGRNPESAELFARKVVEVANKAAKI